MRRRSGGPAERGRHRALSEALRIGCAERVRMWAEFALQIEPITLSSKEIASMALFLRRVFDKPFVFK